MASTPIEFEAPSGLTLTADLVAADDTSVSAGLAATELTNGDGRYRVTYTGTETGHHTLHPKDASNQYYPHFHYILEDTTAVQYPIG